MTYETLQKLRKRRFFTVEDVSETLRIRRPSARVLCNRYVKKGIFIRLKNNFYVLEQNWENFSTEDFLKISNFLQVPSYVSFMTALSFYEVTTQVQRGFFESASLKRTARFSAKGMTFNFYKLKKDYYFDFVKVRDLFIATQEKAFVDAVYLVSFGKYKFDLDSLDLGKLNKSRVKKIMAVYPAKTKRIIRDLCKI